MTTKEISWLAGLLEGEGCFSLAGSYRTTPCISVTSTDLDVIEEIKRLVKCKGEICILKGKGNEKVAHQLKIQAKPAIQWMMTIYPLMKSRRQGKIKEIIDFWKNHKYGERNDAHHRKTEYERLVQEIMDNAS